MNYASVRQYLNDMRDKRVLVIGDLIIDRYITGSESKISPEAPVPVVNGEIKRWSALGGAGNVVNTIAQHTHDVHFISLTGKLETDQNTHVPIVISHRTPPVKTRVMCKGQHVCRIDEETLGESLPESSWNRVIDEIRERLVKRGPFNSVVLSDYGKSGTSQVFYHNLFIMLSNVIDKDTMIVVDSKQKYWVPQLASPLESLITPNASEWQAYSELNGFTCPTLVTMGNKGMTYMPSTGSAVHVYPLKKVDVRDACGAGDTVTAMCALLLSPNEGLAQREAKLSMVQLVAERSVQKLGVSPPSVGDILEHAQEVFG